MISKYLSSRNELKEYFVNNVAQGTAKSGQQYTRCRITDKKTKDDGSVTYNNYTIFSWQPDIVMHDGDKITFSEIKGIEIEEGEYNGKPVLNKVIFADVNVIQKEPNKVEVVDDLPALEPIDSSELPF